MATPCEVHGLCFWRAGGRLHDHPGDLDETEDDGKNAEAQRQAQASLLTTGSPKF